jgi:hypothetical protein
MSAPPVRFVVFPIRSRRDFWSWHKEFEKQKHMSLRSSTSGGLNPTQIIADSNHARQVLEVLESVGKWLERSEGLATLGLPTCAWAL